MRDPRSLYELNSDVSVPTGLPLVAGLTGYADAGAAVAQTTEYLLSTVFLQKVWKLDASRRDLATPEQAFADFQIVVDRYPNSRYAEDARARMADLRNLFARHELDVALYYLRRTAYVAAADRAKRVLEVYPQSKYQSDAVATLVVAYDGLGNKALADDARRVLQQNDPNHPLLTGEDWPDFPSNLRKLNPFAGDKSPLEMGKDN